MQQALQEIRQMMARSRPFEHVEAFIESCGRLSEEECAVLWLIAWMGGEPSVVAAERGRPRSDDHHVHDVLRQVLAPR